MNIQFIGTGSGIASVKRHHSSIVLDKDDFRLLVDAGDGVSHALLQQNISFHSVDAVLISHLHPDHYTGFAALLSQMKLRNRTAPLAVWIYKDDIPYLKDFLRHSYLFLDRFDFPVGFHPISDDGFFTPAEGLTITAAANTHLQPYRAYDIAGELSFRSHSFLFSDGNVNLFHTCDIGSKDDLYLFRGSRIDYFITEVTHVAYEELIEAVKVLQPEKVFITHITDEEIAPYRQGGGIEEGLSAEIIFCSDGDEFHLS